MQEFKVVFYNGEEVNVFGTKIYSDDSNYYIESGDSALEYDRKEVKCISPVEQ